LLKDEDPDVRAAVARALGRLRDPRAVDPLVAVLGDSDLNVLKTGKQALTNIGQLLVEPLIAALGDASPEVRWMAVAVLNAMANPERTEPGYADLIAKTTNEASKEKIGELCSRVLARPSQLDSKRSYSRSRER
jgi:HEAT repeat protein